jgi:carbonic anhydrase
MKEIFKNIIIALLLTTINSQLNYNQLYHSGSACINGRQQSPISLTEDNSSFNSTVNLLFDTYNPIVQAKLRFDERILYISHNNEGESLGYITLSRNGILKQYALKRIEIYNPGEHMVNNKTSDLEIQFIHEQVLFFETDVNQFRSLEDTNTNLIISILYNTTSLISDNGFLSELVSTYNGSPIQSINLDNYGLIRDRQFFFYEGSFNYNPCNENVNYIVIAKPFFITPEEKSQTYEWFMVRYLNANTAKVIAPLYGRTVNRNYALENELSGRFLKITCMLIIMYMSLY